MGTSSGDRDSPQAAVALSAEVRCFVCVRCVCVCDRHRGPTAEHTSGLLLGCGPRTPQPWSNLEPRLESWELGPMASCFPRRPRSPSKAQLCLFLPRPLWERMLRGGPRASPRHLAHLHSLGGQGLPEPAWSPETAREPSPRLSRTLYHKRVNTTLRRTRPLDSCLMLFPGQVP